MGLGTLMDEYDHVTICPYCGCDMEIACDLPTPTGLRLIVKMCPRCFSRKTIGVDGELFFEFVKQVENKLREFYELHTGETSKE